MPRPIRNFTSVVPAAQSIANIETALIEAGAKSIVKDYAAGDVTGLCFVIDGPEGAQLTIRLPAKVEKVFDVLYKAVKPQNRFRAQAKIREQATRTAWKLVYEWVDIQLTLNRMGQVKLGEVFLPYLWDGQQTLYSMIDKPGGLAALTGALAQRALPPAQTPEVPPPC